LSANHLGVRFGELVVADGAPRVFVQDLDQTVDRRRATWISWNHYAELSIRAYPHLITTYAHIFIVIAILVAPPNVRAITQFLLVACATDIV
jgi:hypothetical protein